jgi:hypothetical protein
MLLKFENPTIRRFGNLLLVLVFTTSLSAQTWRASEFHGITAGKSNKAEVLKAFGDPAEVRKPSLAAFANETCCEELLYHGRGDNGGELSIAVRKNGAVVYILDQFKSAMPRSTAYRKYGKDWHDHAYSSAKCARARRNCSALPRSGGTHRTRRVSQQRHALLAIE